DSAGSSGYLNALWKYDGTNWTWISGSNTMNQPGVYGTRGVADSANVPGARLTAVSWVDSSGDIWLFGGLGYPSAGDAGYLNDLWRFDGTDWIWVSGSNTINQAGVYGTEGIAASSNIPGARIGAVSWIDSNGALWLFGGNGYDSSNIWHLLSDLWKYR
ncbi:MAG: hypothetical protein L7F78_11335, partial [Syntrophales bacterium LBB04]|nr:hypothetical protein [Syntrophales bacterium LBB04]